MTQDFKKMTPKFGISMKNGSRVTMNDKIGRAVARSVVMGRYATKHYPVTSDSTDSSRGV